MGLRTIASACVLACVVATGTFGSAVLRAGGLAIAAPAAVVLRDPDGHLVDPFLAAENSAAIVFLFASVDCPISNRYAPAVQRLHAAFAPKNVAFWLIYPNPGDTPDAVRAHLQDYSYPVHALLDPRHDLVKLTKVSVTPEAAVFDRSRSLAYRGRIDNRYVSLGVERPAASQHDLLEAIDAVLAGTPVSATPAPAVGCFIADFVQ